MHYTRPGIQIISTIITATILFLFTSCSFPSKERYQMARAEILMHTLPDSALYILKNIEAEQLQNRHDIALYSLLYSQALDKNYIDITSDSIISTAVHYYSKSKNFNRKAQSLYYLGRIHYNAGESTPAAEAFLEAKEAVLETDNHFLSGQIYNALGKLYYEQHQYLEATDAYKNSSNFFNLAKEPKRYANALSYTGKCYYLLGKDSIAIKYHKEAINVYGTINYINGILKNSYSVADIFDNLNSTQSAIEFIQEINNKYNEGDIPTRFYPLLCRLYYKNNNIKMAKHYGLESLPYLTESSLELSGVLLVLNKIYTSEQNYKIANFYYEKYINVRSELYRSEKNLQIKVIESKYSKTKLTEKYSSLKTKHTRNKIIYVLIIAILICSSSVFYCIQKTRENKLKSKYIQDIKSLEKLNKNIELHITNTLDNEIISGIKLRINFIKNLLDMAYVTENHPEKFYNKFKEFTKTLNLEHSGSDLIFIANKTNNGIINHLKESYPTLTEKELLYCSLICLGFSPNAIRMMLNHQNTTSLYNTNSKINNKLKIKHIKLEKFIKQLSAELEYKNRKNNN